jgi:hypothetical protein
MNTFNRAIAARMRNELSDFLQDFCKKYEVEIIVGKCRYSNIEMKYDLIVKSGNKELVKRQEQEEWESSCRLYGFQKSDYGKTFDFKGDKFKLVGFNYRKRRFPVKATRVSDGRMFGFVAEDIVMKIHGKVLLKEVV